MSYRHGEHHKKGGCVFFQQVFTKSDFSDSLWTKFGLELTKYATEIEVNIKQVI